MLLGALEFNNIPVPVRIVLILLVVAFGGWVVYMQLRDYVLDWQTSKYGQPTLGWIVQASDVLYQEGRGHATAVVLVSPDDETGDDEIFMTELAEQMMKLKGIRGNTKEEKYVSRLVTDEKYIRGKRDKLPKPFAGGRKVYAAHVIVQRALLPKRKLVEPFVFCLIPWDKPGAPAWTISSEEFKKRKRQARSQRSSPPNSGEVLEVLPVDDPSLVVKCPSCKHTLKVRGSNSGKKVRCPSCKTVFSPC